MLHKQGAPEGRVADLQAAHQTTDKTLGDKVVAVLGAHAAFSTFAMGFSGRVVPGRCVGLSPEGQEGLIGIEVRNGIVRLTGEVSTPRLRKLAATVVASIPECQGTENDLVVDHDRGHA